MTPFLTGFADELVKVAVVSRIVKNVVGIPKSMMAHPKRWIYGALGASVLAGSALAATAGYKSGRSGGKGRYLHAGVTSTGKVIPSEAAYYNFSKHFPRGRSKKERKRPTKHYKRKTFRS